MIYNTIKAICIVGLAAGVGAAPAVELDEMSLNKEQMTRGRELFPLFAGSQKCARLREVHESVAHRRGCSTARTVEPMMSIGDAQNIKTPVKTLEMLALNDDLNTVVSSDNMCTRRHAMARAAGLAAGLAMATVNQPGFAAETKMVKMGSDSGQLVFVPDEIKVCKGDTVTWTNNKGGPHNVVFDEDAIPAGVDQGKISMDDQLGDEGATFSMKFDVAGEYQYYCEPHRGAGMQATLKVA